MVQSYGAAGMRSEEKVRNFRSQVEEKAEGALDSVTDAAKEIEKRAESAFAATKQFVQEQPLVALAGVAAFGLALGALWKLTPSRRSYQASDVFDRVADALQPHYQALRRRW